MPYASTHSFASRESMSFKATPAFTNCARTSGSLTVFSCRRRSGAVCMASSASRNSPNCLCKDLICSKPSLSFLINPSLNNFSGFAINSVNCSSPCAYASRRLPLVSFVWIFCCFCTWILRVAQIMLACCFMIAVMIMPSCTSLRFRCSFGSTGSGSTGAGAGAGAPTKTFFTFPKMPMAGAAAASLAAAWRFSHSAWSICHFLYFGLGYRPSSPSRFPFTVAKSSRSGRKSVPYWASLYPFGIMLASIWCVKKHLRPLPTVSASKTFSVTVLAIFVQRVSSSSLAALTYGLPSIISLYTRA
mmetsp:Transcript_17502/g.45971  ORF Transcript_17502/g.45971 Transcript_17502/m.45971 type:complete len:302 (+) Transcript_17502:153-1058(+)